MHFNPLGSRGLQQAPFPPIKATAEWSHGIYHQQQDPTLDTAVILLTFCYSHQTLQNSKRKASLLFLSFFSLGCTPQPILRMRMVPISITLVSKSILGVVTKQNKLRVWGFYLYFELGICIKNRSQTHHGSPWGRKKAL